MVYDTIFFQSYTEKSRTTPPPPKNIVFLELKKHDIVFFFACFWLGRFRDEGQQTTTNSHYYNQYLDVTFGVEYICPETVTRSWVKQWEFWFPCPLTDFERLLGIDQLWRNRTVNKKE